MSTLFTQASSASAAPGRHVQRGSASKQSQRESFDEVRGSGALGRIAQMMLERLKQVGRAQIVGYDDKNIPIVKGGATFHELSEYVSSKRGVATDVNSLTQAKKDLLKACQLEDSGLRRMGDKKKRITVWQYPTREMVRVAELDVRSTSELAKILDNISAMLCANAATPADVEYQWIEMTLSSRPVPAICEQSINGILQAIRAMERLSVKEQSIDYQETWHQVFGYLVDAIQIINKESGS